MKKDWMILAVGVITTAVLFAVPAYFYAHWLALTLSFISAVVFTLFLLRRNREQLGRSYKLARIGVIVLIFSGASFITHDYIMAKWQGDLLVNIRDTINSGIVGVKVKNDMIQTLKTYRTSGKDEITISQAFADHMGENLNDDGSIEPEIEDEEKSVSYFYVIEDDNTVKIIGVTKVSEGKDADFRNYDGQTGMAQYEGTITSEGVRYEKVN